MRISLSGIIITLAGGGLFALGVLVMGASQSAIHEILAAILVGTGSITGALGLLISQVATLRRPRKQLDEVDDAILRLSADVDWLREQKVREIKDDINRRKR